MDYHVIVTSFHICSKRTYTLYFFGIGFNKVSLSEAYYIFSYLLDQGGGKLWPAGPIRPSRGSGLFCVTSELGVVFTSVRGHVEEMETEREHV